jgi:hypothetical protein
MDTRRVHVSGLGLGVATRKIGVISRGIGAGSAAETEVGSPPVIIVAKREHFCVSLVQIFAQRTSSDCFFFLLLFLLRLGVSDTRLCGRRRQRRWGSGRACSRFRSTRTRSVAASVGPGLLYIGFERTRVDDTLESLCAALHERLDLVQRQVLFLQPVSRRKREERVMEGGGSMDQGAGLKWHGLSQPAVVPVARRVTSVGQAIVSMTSKENTRTRPLVELRLGAPVECRDRLG